MHRLIVFLFALYAWAANYPTPVEGDHTARDFKFTTGQTLPEVRLHYTTLGKPVRDSQGIVRNAVLILHGTGGTGRAFLSATFGEQLFGPGQLLDATKYYIILPDGLGHGKSSKPSDGMRAKFPLYTYDDMVRAHHRLLTEGLGVNHLRLILGTSMGAMHCWVWGEMYPEFMDALMPLASVPATIAGRNRMLRKMIIDLIRSDPGYNDGNYTGQPKSLLAAHYILTVMTSSPIQMLKQSPTRAQADEAVDRIKGRAERADANDMLYAYESSREYDPSPNLETIQAHLFAINSADDEVNPPELGILEREIKRVKKGRALVLPITDQTRGHGTHSLPSIWGSYLAELLAESERPSAKP